MFLLLNDNEQDPTQQTAIDNFMVQQLDGTVNEWGWCKQKVLSRLSFIYLLRISDMIKTVLIFLVLLQLGANAILAVSLAVCKAGASVKKIPLYKVNEL